MRPRTISRSRTTSHRTQNEKMVFTRMTYRERATRLMTKDLILAELERHQDLLLPHTAAHLSESNLDVGCGSGVASLVHAARFGLSPILCDVVDIRHAQAGALPFRLIDGRTLPFHEQSFGSS